MSEVDISTNAADLRDTYVLMGRRMDDALRKGMRRLVLSVEQQAVKRLTGAGTAKAGSYPVPIRSGVLRRSMGVRIAGPLLGFVFNRAEYAKSIHDGFHPYGNKKAPWVMGRRFMDDAVDAVDGNAIMQTALRAGLNP